METFVPVVQDKLRLKRTGVINDQSSCPELYLHPESDDVSIWSYEENRTYWES